MRRHGGEVIRPGIVPGFLPAVQRAHKNTSQHQRGDRGQRKARAQDQGGQRIQPGGGPDGSLGILNAPPDILLEARRQRRGSARLTKERADFRVSGMKLIFFHR